MTAPVAHIGEIDRGQCRAAAEQRFSLARMAADDDRLYRVILEHPGRPMPGRPERARYDRIRGPSKCFSPRTDWRGSFGAGSAFRPMAPALAR